MPTLTIPDDVHRELAARAAEQHTTVDELATRILAADAGPRPESVFDTEYEAECAAECAADPTPMPTMEEVHAIMAKIPGSLSADMIAEREERF